MRPVKCLIQFLDIKCITKKHTTSSNNGFSNKMTWEKPLCYERILVPVRTQNQSCSIPKATEKSIQIWIMCSKAPFRLMYLMHPECNNSCLELGFLRNSKKMVGTEEKYTEKHTKTQELLEETYLSRHGNSVDTLDILIDFWVTHAGFKTFPPWEQKIWDIGSYI